MKDKELRDLLVDSGVVKERKNIEYGTWLESVPIGEKIDAIVRYLGITFERIPESVIAKKKDAPEKAVEDVVVQQATAAVMP